MFIGGHSAGGHLSALLATDETYLKAEGLTLDHIKGVVPISGVFRLPESGRSFQHAFGNDPKMREAAAPTWHAQQLAKNHDERKLPPFLILFAENDFDLCGKKLAEEFCKALCDCTCKAEVREIMDRNHVTIFAYAGKENDAVSNAILKFVSTHSTR
jgi:arylformamidase